MNWNSELLITEKSVDEKLIILFILSSEQKIEEYRKNGAIIGENVEIGYGSKLICDYLYLKKDSKIGSNCYIKAFSFELGEMSIIGNNANIVLNNTNNYTGSDVRNSLLFSI